MWGVGVRPCRTMMSVMETRTIDHGATLLAIDDVAVGDVFAYLRSRCSNRALAEDLIADTFLAAVGQIRRGRVNDVTVAWLIGIARHKLLDEWRRAARRPRTGPRTGTTLWINLISAGPRCGMPSSISISSLR